MLTPSGLYFGDGPASLMSDPLAAPVFETGLALMVALIQMTEQRPA